MSLGADEDQQYTHIIQQYCTLERAMAEKITEIDVLCRDGSSDPVVVNVFIQKPLGVWQDDDKLVEALGFSYIPGITKLSEIIAHGWMKAEKEPIPHYQGGKLPARKLIRE